MKERFIKINTALAGFTQGQQWPYDEAPDVIKMWREKKAILFETQICSLVDKAGRLIEGDKGEDSKDTPASEKKEPQEDKTSEQKAQDEINKLFRGDEENGSNDKEESKEKDSSQKDSSEETSSEESDREENSSTQKKESTKKKVSTTGKKKTGRPKGSKNKRKATSKARKVKKHDNND